MCLIAWLRTPARNDAAPYGSGRFSPRSSSDQAGPQHVQPGRVFPPRQGVRVQGGMAPERVREGSCQTRFVRPFRPLCVVAGLCLLYSRLLRRRILTWGATEVEASARLPGDELLEDAD